MRWLMSVAAAVSIVLASSAGVSAAEATYSCVLISPSVSIIEPELTEEGAKQFKEQFKGVPDSKIKCIKI